MAMDHQRLAVGGIPLNVYTSKADSASTEVFILFFLHGRLEDSKYREYVVEELFEALGEHQKRDLVVVSFDQRNHGHRVVSPRANEGWRVKNKSSSKYNPLHAVDMFSIISGTAHDVSLLIDFLPSYLYPTGEKTIVTWGVSGVSLGGHATWLSLVREPRLSVGIPIIGCPDYMGLLVDRAKRNKVPLDDPGHFPESFKSLAARTSPASVAYIDTDPSKNPFIGRKILVMSGKDDALVPWDASEEFVGALEVGEDGVKEVMVQEGTGHECTPEMVNKLAGFLLEKVL